MSEETKDEYQVCFRHPDRKTLLRCNKCGRPICLECAVQTPTGYRCKECIKNQQKVFSTAEGKDYVIGAAIAFAAGLAGSVLDQMIPLLPSFLTAFIIGGICGRLTCRAVRSAVNRRRSDTLTKTVVTAAGIGALIPRLTGLYVSFIYLLRPQTLISGLIQIILNLLFVFVLCAEIWSEMNGMVFRR